MTKIKLNLPPPGPETLLERITKRHIWIGYGVLLTLAIGVMLWAGFSTGNFLYE